MKEFAASEWQRAHRALASAEKLVKSDPDSSASRVYYAAFHALTALFALRDQTFSKHSAIRAALHRDLVQTEQFEAQLGQDYDFLMDLREAGDYGGIAHVTADSAATAVRKAKAFIEAVGRTCPELSKTND